MKRLAYSLIASLLLPALPAIAQNETAPPIRQNAVSKRDAQVIFDKNYQLFHSAIENYAADKDIIGIIDNMASALTQGAKADEQQVFDFLNLSVVPVPVFKAAWGTLPRDAQDRYNVDGDSYYFPDKIKVEKISFLLDAGVQINDRAIPVLQETREAASYLMEKLDLNTATNEEMAYAVMFSALPSARIIQRVRSVDPAWVENAETVAVIKQVKNDPRQLNQVKAQTSNYVDNSFALEIKLYEISPAPEIPGEAGTPATPDSRLAQSKSLQPLI